MNTTGRRAFCVATAALGAGVARGQAAGLDVAGLSRQRFYETLEPLARREGRVVFYNFAGNFDSAWKRGLIGPFEARYGIRVQHHKVRKDHANRQLMALRRAGVRPPADVYFAGGSESYGLLSKAGVLAAADMARLLPNLAGVPAQFTDTVFGVPTHGRWPVVHRNQVVLARDAVRLAEADLPADFDALLAWAERHRGQLAISSPAKGGAAAGFLYAAALRFAASASSRSTLAATPQSHEQAVVWAHADPDLVPLWRYLQRLFRAADVTNGNADTMNLLNNRKALIGVAWEDMVVNFVQSQQLPPTTRSSVLAPGLVFSGDGLVLIAHGPNPAAALLLMDMAFGREFQTWKLANIGSRSPRPDVDADAAVRAALPSAMAPRAQVEAWSVPANWAMTRALVQVFEDKVLERH